MLILGIGASAPAGAYTIHGIGVQSCATALANNELDKNADDKSKRSRLLRIWIIGYVAGALSYAPDSSVFSRNASIPAEKKERIRNYDLDGMTYLLKRQCEKDPTADIDDAIDNVIKNLKNEN